MKRLWPFLDALTYGPSKRVMGGYDVDRRGFLKNLKGAVGWVATAAVAESAVGLVPAYQDQIPFIGHADAAGLGASFRVDLAASAQHQAKVFPQSVAAATRTRSAPCCGHALIRRWPGGDA